MQERTPTATTITRPGDAQKVLAAIDAAKQEHDAAEVRRIEAGRAVREKDKAIDDARKAASDARTFDALKAARLALRDAQEDRELWSDVYDANQKDAAEAAQRLNARRRELDEMKRRREALGLRFIKDARHDMASKETAVLEAARQRDRTITTKANQHYIDESAMELRTTAADRDRAAAKLAELQAEYDALAVLPDD